MTLTLHRRSVYVDISSETSDAPPPSGDEIAALESLDLIYRSLCAVLYNYVPTSGHPGGSISSGRFVAALCFDTLDYDLSDPDRADADVISYAAGHKAMGLYALWALRNEIAQLQAPDLLPSDPGRRLRLEDLLGFRRNPVTALPLYRLHQAKPLDGHPTPATPFVRLATGASGVGLASSIGLCIGAADRYGVAAPRVHVVEGEGGLTPGRVAEALAAAGTACLGNALLHIDWNQASIDSNAVCREDGKPGDYVQWNPMELCFLHDWNVVYVPDGTSIPAILRAQRRALQIDNGQPTAIVYRTVKGWQYGVEGKASHGAGHKLCAPGFYKALEPLLHTIDATLPSCEAGLLRCSLDKGETMEQCFFEALTIVRKAIEGKPSMAALLAGMLRRARERLDGRARAPRRGAPRVEAVFDAARAAGETIPSGLRLEPGATTTLRGELGRVLNHYNRLSGGALLGAAADLLGSTSLSVLGEGFAAGYWNAAKNPEARLLSTGGICEDAMTGILCGLSSYGSHIGVGSSYGAFLAPLGHVAARLHAIGSQARQSVLGGPHRTAILVCAHAGLKTGEDGPTHADPQALQLLQENFPEGTVITLTPWDPQELWPLMTEALRCRPAIIAPFVTRPAETVLDRAKLGLPPASASAAGIYRLRRANGAPAGTLLLQGSAVTYAFLETTLPLLEMEGIDLDVFYVASVELFDALPDAERQRLWPEERARTSMGITDFTLPTMARFITSGRGRAATLHPFKKGHYLGSGPGPRVLEEAGLDGASQFEAIKRFLGHAPE